MPRVVFTPNLKRHVDCPEVEATGETVREVLDEVFSANTQLRGYVVDEQGRVRTHMVIFVDGQRLMDRDGLSDSVQESSEIYVMQALSGG